MVLFSIPDIRLFWSTDPRFLTQFQQGEIKTFRPYSKYPSCFKDVSFWIGQDVKFHENDFCDIIRDTAGDLVENVQKVCTTLVSVVCYSFYMKIDDFIHPKTKRTSLCFRINYRSMDRSLANDEINHVQSQVVSRLKDQLGVEIR